jgi:hypothetical protein
MLGEEFSAVCNEGEHERQSMEVELGP